MERAEQWPRTGVVGAGAVGGYFGGMLARAGAPVVMIGRKAFVDAVNTHGLIIDRPDGQLRIHANASTEVRAVRKCALILFCGKANNTSAVAQQMAPYVSPETTVV